MVSEYTKRSEAERQVLKLQENCSQLEQQLTRLELRQEREIRCNSSVSCQTNAKESKQEPERLRNRDNTQESCIFPQELKSLGGVEHRVTFRVEEKENYSCANTLPCAIGENLQDSGTSIQIEKLKNEDFEAPSDYKSISSKDLDVLLERRDPSENHERESFRPRQNVTREGSIFGRRATLASGKCKSLKINK